MRSKFRLSLALSVGVLAIAGAALGAETFTGVKITPQGHMGVGTPNPDERLHVKGDSIVTGTMKGTGFEGRFRDAARIQGFSATNQPAEFAFVYDYQNKGNSPDAIQIHNVAANVFKTFIIPHPVERERYLVHATLEGPEGAVFYRGSARLRDGRAEVALPDYFEDLTRRDGRTIILTNVDGFDRLAVQRVDGRKIRDGSFRVISDTPDSTQAFDWEVKAVRADKPRLDVEPRADEVSVGGLGPYTYQLGRR